MRAKDFAKILQRDQYRCYHCGKSDETLIPQHRVNRGMGGSKTRNNPSNLITLCSYFNGAVEASEAAQTLAKRMGWKCESWQDTREAAVYDFSAGVWYKLDDSYTRQQITK